MREGRGGQKGRRYREEVGREEREREEEGMRNRERRRERAISDLTSVLLSSHAHRVLVIPGVNSLM